MKVLIFAGHPRKNSFSHALVQAHYQWAVGAGADVKEIILADMQFDLIVLTSSPQA